MKCNGYSQKSLFFLNFIAIFVLFYVLDILNNVHAENDIRINITKLTDQIFYLYGPNANLLLFTGKDGVLLVDDEMLSTTEHLKNVISNLTSQPVKFIINTHWHPDHTEANKIFGRDGAIIISHDNTRERLTKPQFTSFDNTTTPAYPPEALPSITYDNNMKLYFNDEEIKIMYAENAHTDGDSIVYFTKNNIINMGDIYSDKAFPYIDIDSSGNITSLIVTLENMASEINNETRIVAGHSGVSNLTELNYYTDMLKDIKNKTQEMKNEGKEVEEIIAEKPTLEYEKIYTDDSYVQGDNLTDFIYDTLE